MTSGLIQYGVPLTDVRSFVFPELKLYEQKHKFHWSFSQNKTK